MKAFRRRLPWMAYVGSLFVLWAALWLPTSVMGQVLPGSPFQGGSGGGTSRAFVVCPLKILSNTSATVQPIATVTTTSGVVGAVSLFFTTRASSTAGQTINLDAGSLNISWFNDFTTLVPVVGAVFGQVDNDESGTLATTVTATVVTNTLTINFTPTWVTIVPTLVQGFAIFQVNSSETLTCSI